MAMILNIVSKGNSSHLMKATANRRKSKIQIKEEKMKAQIQAAEVQEKLDRYT